MTLKGCDSCRKVTICFLYREAVVIQKQWDEINGNIVKIPMIPTTLALSCPEYESPSDVIKMSKDSKELPAQ